MMRLICAMGLSGALIVSACSSSSGNKNDSGAGGSMANDGGGDAADAGPALVTVSGTAAPHPLTKALDPTNDFTMINVAVVDPAIVIANPTAAPLQGGPLDTSAGNCMGANGCLWSFDNVNISSISLGLVGILDDARTSGRLWVKTGTGAGSAATINMFKMTRAPITNVPLFAVSTATEAKLAMFAAGVLTTDTTLMPGALTARGFMIGTVVSKLSEGAKPIAGATVTTGDTRVNIIYPNADFSGVGQSTAAPHGSFLVVPKPVATQTAIVATWTVTPPSGDTRTWPMLTAGSTPGTAFVILFAANE